MKKNKVWRKLRLCFAAAVLALWGAAFSGAVPIAARIMGRTQFIPALLCAGIPLAVLLLLTIFFGRFYCAWLCPLGIIQDLLRWPLSRQRPGRIPTARRMRLLICGWTLGMLICGWTAGFLWLDPYSNFGRIAGAFAWVGAGTLAVLAGLTVWKPRLFCSAVCPAGTMLGAVSRCGVFHWVIRDSCVKCGRCAEYCPAGCIDLESGTIDDERCFRCMKCLASCLRDAIGFQRRRPELPEFSRRKFLINSGVFAVGCAAGALTVKSGLARWLPVPAASPVLPPGGGDTARFAARCTGCQLCVRNCPAGIIVPASGGAPGPVSLDLSRGGCRFDCNRCGRVCPTGAIRFLPLAEKRRTRIAEARFNPRHCVVFQFESPCGKCAAACPTGAIRLRKNGTPRPVDRKLCIGCGACQQVCPASPKAMTVKSVEIQTLIAKES
ncbi:MAG: 4Fe-4S binding protein [Lentisphaeria bacterium]|nr:4Fe-4S binding protein [Lentisphaeria bacterium]